MIYVWLCLKAIKWFESPEKENFDFKNSYLQLIKAHHRVNAKSTKTPEDQITNK